jgi:catechol 2,3-dioxygenase-like lactoylglutathione lyase family enzyme
MEVRMMLADNEVIALVATAQPERARQFYADVLGLHLAADEPPALVFDAHGTMLRIAKVGQLAPARYTVLGWKVGDIRAAVRALASKGVVFERYAGFAQDELGIWTSPDGNAVAWFKDPDGNTLSLTQFRAA